MTNSKITILSNTKEIEANKKITLAIKGRGITIDALDISPASITIYFTRGEVKSVQATKEDKAKYKAIYNQILSDLKRGIIHSNKDYHYRDFSGKYQISNLFMPRKHTESSTPTQLINGVSVDPTETTTENSIFNITLEASSEPIEASIRSKKAKVLNLNAAGVFLSENTMHNPYFADDTELARSWLEMKKEEKEHLNNTMREIKGEVSIRFGSGQSIPERPILGYNDTKPNLSLPGLIDSMQPLERALWSARIGVLLGGLGVGAVVAAVGVGTAYCNGKRSQQGQYDVEKAEESSHVEVQSLLTQPGIDTTSSKVVI